MRILLAMAVLSLSACVTRGEVVASVPAPPTVSVSGGVSVGMFDSDLAPYGRWLSVGSYGDRCWQPYPSVVGYEFQPYLTGGSWVYTDVGWQFESDYPFGWATFHYGRWLNDPYSGWCWAPDTEWAPSWVTWRFGSGYVGWAPLAPAGYVVRAQPAWTFVAAPYFVTRDVYRYRLGAQDYHRAYSVTRPVAPSSGGYVVGPPPRQIESMAGRPVPTAPPARGRPPPGGTSRPWTRPGPQMTTPPPAQPYQPPGQSAPPPQWNQPPERGQPQPPPAAEQYQPPGQSAPPGRQHGPAAGGPPPRAVPQGPVAAPPQGVPAAPQAVEPPPEEHGRREDQGPPEHRRGPDERKQDKQRQRK